MKFNNGYRHYILEYVLDRWIPISRHDTYVGALANVTAEHQVIRHLDAMKTPFRNNVPDIKVRQAVFFRKTGDNNDQQKHTN